MNSTTIKAKFHGIRPILFDRYAGDNKTKLEPLEKFYINQAGQCCIPVLNVFSLLAAWNTASVAKRFYGRDGKAIATGVMAFCDVSSGNESDPTNAVLCDDQGNPYTPADSRIQIIEHVARTPTATTNPKERPMIPTGWTVEFVFTHTENEFVAESTFRKMIEQGGILGLGTFRPIFGRYRAEIR